MGPHRRYACANWRRNYQKTLGPLLAYHDGGLSAIKSEPSYAALHTDPRWEDFMIKVGKSRAQLEAIEFDVKLPFRGGR
jgi:hypothetical protein